MKPINETVLEERIILGIDPGTFVMGYGLIQISKGAPYLLKMEVLELDKRKSYYQRLCDIFNKILELIDEFLPKELAIESPFLGKNVKSLLKLGQVQGVALAAALSRDISIYEYAPLKIKMAITGNGQASKEQVAGMLRHYLRIPKENIRLDATDGAATALCHFFQSDHSFSKTTRYANWRDFLIKYNKRKIVTF